MNIEDLRKLKETLEKTEKYLPISCLYRHENIIGLPMTREEIVAQENTDEVVLQCEKLIERAVCMLAGNQIPFDHLDISSDLGLLVNPEYAFELKNLASKYENDEVDSDYIYNMYQNVKTQVYPNVVPVSFKFNYWQTGTSDGWAVERFAQDADLNPDKLFELGIVRGIVDWNKFVTKMKALGYNINFLNYDLGTSFDDYIEAILTQGDDTEVDITAEFGRTHKM